MLETLEIDNQQLSHWVDFRKEVLMEVKRFKGQIISKNRYILDQLSEEDNKWYWEVKVASEITYGDHMD